MNDAPDRSDAAAALRKAQKQLILLNRLRLQLSVQLAGLDQRHGALRDEIRRLEARVDGARG